MQKNVQGKTQTLSDLFHIIARMMNKNAPRYSANYTHRFAILVHKCHSSYLIFKIVMEIQVQGNFTTFLKVVS